MLAIIILTEGNIKDKHENDMNESIILAVKYRHNCVSISKVPHIVRF